jgi:phosphoglucomutase/phosphomannomutase
MSLARQPLPCAELASPAIERVGRDDDEAYLDYVAGQAVSGARDVRLVFSPLHGVGARTVPPVLARAGFGDMHRVEAQCVADPAFGSLPGGIANPEQPAALAALIARCRELDADAGLAADPDADRLGFVARDPAAPDGYRVFNGNELATLIVWHTLESLSRQGRLAPNALVMRSVVGSDRIAALCADAGVELWGDLPIGFKWVGGLLAAGVGDDRLLAAVDESHGYNRGALVRDKDAASAALALAELAADCRARGMLVGDVLAGIEARHGLFDERVVSQPLARLADGERVLDALRRRPPRELLGRRVTRLVDRQATPWVNPATGLPHPESFLLLWLEGARLGVRVSGTEPKLKIYVLARAPHGSDRQALAEFAAALPAALLCNAGGA